MWGSRRVEGRIIPAINITVKLIAKAIWMVISVVEASQLLNSEEVH